MAIPPVRVAVFASGNGSNFRAIDKALRKERDAPAEIVLCISNNPKPGAFEYAMANGIPTVRISPKMYEQEEEYDRELLALLQRNGVELIVLAGYMRLLPPGVITVFRRRILNIHPALLPGFGGKGMYGMNVHTAVLAAGKGESGATVHYVDEEYDTGEIVEQECVPILPDDTPERLAARVLEAEHRLFPKVVMDIARRITEEKKG